MCIKENVSVTVNGLWKSSLRYWQNSVKKGDGSNTESSIEEIEIITIVRRN
jgi:hypothetical protein